MIDEKELLGELDTWWEMLSPRTDARDSIICDVIESVIEKINNAEKVREWIPVAERKPKELIDVLVTVRDIQNGDSMLVMIGNYKDWWQVYDIDGTEQSNVRVVAWMPLPEAYGGEGNI